MRDAGPTVHLVVHVTSRSDKDEGGELASISRFDTKEEAARFADLLIALWCDLDRHCYDQIYVYSEQELGEIHVPALELFLFEGPGGRLAFEDEVPEAEAEEWRQLEELNQDNWRRVAEVLAAQQKR
jgi:hypothetical protein